MSWVVVWVQVDFLSPAAVRTFGPYETRAEAFRARSRVYNDRVYGKGGSGRDSVYLAEIEQEDAA